MENKCEHCLYYIEHYIKHNSFFRPIGGHCVNPELNKKYTRNRYALHENCEHWESNESKKAERKEHIKETLQLMEQHLKDIEFILKDDE